MASCASSSSSEEFGPPLSPLLLGQRRAIEPKTPMKSLLSASLKSTPVLHQQRTTPTHASPQARREKTVQALLSLPKKPSPPESVTSDAPSGEDRLLQLFTNRYPPMQERIVTAMKNTLSGVEIACLVAAMSTSRTCSTDSINYIKNRIWDWNNLCAQYFKDPRAFRSVQARAQALITSSAGFLYGSSAEASMFMTCFFDQWHSHHTKRCAHVPTIVVQKETAPFPKGTDGSASLMESYLFSEGYARGSEPANVPYLREDGQGVYQEFFHRRRGTVVALVTLPIAPLQYVLRAQEWTMFAAFASWNKAYALFPYTTYRTRMRVRMSPIGVGDERPLQLDGWKTEDASYDKWSLDETLTGDRAVGGAGTWIIPLETDGVEACDMPDARIEAVHFRLRRFGADQFRNTVKACYRPVIDGKIYD
ncbi:hypothetical protein BDV95DRAFT_357815 [Massariosphaeria phaeospora]|uniref:Uncharacterized protein n=1 Tax=Massariosphaeria phaeospora TaxID=100035 RepID=A0A7C8ICN5_9PLEO|nr:hypothetical protein BDV95DRAFT_357815 [Massariosphaeria phaeospora]